MIKPFGFKCFFDSAKKEKIFLAEMGEDPLHPDAAVLSSEGK